MFKKSTMLAAATLGLVGLASTVAQAAPPTDDKKWELTLGGLGSNDVDFDGFDASATVSLGYYFNPQIELGVRQDLGYTDVNTGDDGSAWTGTTRLALDYHFDFDQDQRVIPFVGIVGGYTYGDGVEDSFVAGAEAGVKFYVNDTTFIYGTALYEFIFEDADDADDAADDGRFVYSVGVGFRF